MKSLLLAWMLPVCALMAADNALKVGDYTFTPPAKWESVQPSSPMRKAQLRVSDEKGQQADVIFFHFGKGDGGGTQANIDRWLMQFSDNKNKKVTDQKIGKAKVKVTYVSTDGTYSGGMPGRPATPLPDYSLLGAIIEGEGESGNVFVKMTGPSKLVKSADGEFRKMIASAVK